MNRKQEYDSDGMSDDCEITHCQSPPKDTGDTDSSDCLCQNQLQDPKIAKLYYAYDADSEEVDENNETN